MKISFLVTYYNQEQFVEQSLNSILAVSKPCEWEILVGDDGSSDGTQDIVKEYVQKYPENIALYVMHRDPAVRYAPVQRASANRINLLEKATGDFYCILDGDDYYCDINFVKDAISVFKRHENIAAVMYGYKYVLDGIDGKYHTLPKEYHECIVDKQVYLDSLYTPAGACVFRNISDPQRQQLLKSLGYFDDNDIMIYNMYFGEVYCINRVIYAYRQTGNSVYTSMNRIEQAVLNVQGYDVDSKLIEQKYAKNLLKRNAENILTMYIWKQQLSVVLGEEEKAIYLLGCAHIYDSLAYRILNYEKLQRDDRRILKRIIFAAGKEKPKHLIKQILLCIFGR